jgi:hypothetical protein
MFLKRLKVICRMIQLDTPKYASNGNESSIPKRYLHTCVDGSTIHNSHFKESAWCPSTREKWILCIYTMDCYPIINKNEILSFAVKYMELEVIIISKITQSQEHTIFYAFPHMWRLNKSQPLNQYTLYEYMEIKVNL